MSGTTDIFQEVFENELHKQIQKKIPMFTIAGKVISVNLENFTCDVDPSDGGSEFFDVRLKSIISADDLGILIIPKTQSDVLITMINNDQNRCFISQYSEIEKFHYKLHDLEFDVDSEGYRIKKGDHDLKTVLNDLITEINKIRVINGTTINIAAMNLIRNRLNTILK